MHKNNLLRVFVEDLYDELQEEYFQHDNTTAQPYLESLGLLHEFNDDN